MIIVSSDLVTTETDLPTGAIDHIRSMLKLAKQMHQEAIGASATGDTTSETPSKKVHKNS